MLVSAGVAESFGGAAVFARQKMGAPGGNLGATKWQ